ncbi:CHAD domain-containing protein [Ferrimonas aestuarii]|uniref:CHAD domain-containing protein n=1 Tax=Ferrimonas aestuarii TaxID=2569539 RepID=A0A4U1BTW5_9GAMM|nr:CHAD domain-containing protein [Ferrimonas aestuarii]TKB58639.1 CHAD domain-containing protein [Ferrimonas aestuarii]
MGIRVEKALQQRVELCYRAAIDCGWQINLDGDTEPLHHYRVGLRKCRALLKLYGDWLAPELAQALVASIGQQARVSNRMRDLDVLAKAHWLPQEATEEVANWRRQCFSRLLIALGELTRERQLVFALLACSWKSPSGGKQSFKRVTDKVAMRVERRCDKRLKSAQASQRAEDWHRLRISIKYRRYLKELCLPELDWQQDKRLQDALGEFNDSCAQLAIIDELGNQNRRQWLQDAKEILNTRVKTQLQQLNNLQIV